ncbi:Integrase, catalytic core domain-containing protein [Rozella allomycis CSF55]|uniref:Integrase, catalytic core domain-containing protein n=1 Tax=Rozella allomycis (strain CSF55) TaxID=988480 RepID=A0A075B3N6_ROZAC|nr:Integrase, catalytic core domain-containing protein [Rozella allomycis CSF55]|eukprot:EPZ37032.1 Integrase, catalytic core domain-containing protein [Rozella allomycis CSF55]
MINGFKKGNGKEEHEININNIKINKAMMLVKANQRKENMVSEKMVNIWHERFGHINVERLKELSKFENVEGLTKIDKMGCDEKCKICIQGKMAHGKFPKKESRAAAILEWIHMDICGPFQDSDNEQKYFITFIDDYSRMCHVYTLKNKSDAFEVFENFQKQFTNSINIQTKKIISDNAKEIRSQRWIKLWNKHGIMRQYTVDYCPQQNGVAERKNRTMPPYLEWNTNRVLG